MRCIPTYMWSIALCCNGICHHTLHSNAIHCLNTIFIVMKKFSIRKECSQHSSVSVTNKLWLLIWWCCHVDVLVNPPVILLRVGMSFLVSYTGWAQRTRPEIFYKTSSVLGILYIPYGRLIVWLLKSRRRWSIIMIMMTSLMHHLPYLLRRLVLVKKCHWGVLALDYSLLYRKILNRGESPVLSPRNRCSRWTTFKKEISQMT